NTGYQLSVDAVGHLHSVLNGGAGGADVVGTTLVNDNTFHHVALTFDGNNIKLWDDGELVGQSPFAGVINYEAGSPFTIGRRQHTGGPNSETLPGLIDEATLYNRALSAAEIMSISEAGIAGKCKSADTNAGTPGSTQVADATITGNVSNSGTTTD